MRRLTRKKLKQDDFISVVDLVIHWVTDNWRPLAVGFGAVCVVVLIWWGFTTFSSGRQDKAAYELQAAMKLYSGDESGKGAAPDVEGAKKKLEDVVHRFSHTDQADEARIYLARIAFDKGDVETANTLLQTVSRRHGDDVLGRLSMLDLVHIREQLGQGPEVAKDLEAMAAGTDRRLPRDAALYELGALYVREKKPDQAKEYFQKLVQDFPDSPYQRQAQQRLRELG